MRRRFTGLVLTLAACAALPASASAEVLFNNIDETSPESINSQNFDPVNDAFDAMAADDFVVPSGETWQLTGALVRGTNDGAVPATTADVAIFADAGGAPGAELFTGVATADGYPRMNLSFAGPTLTAGTYWFGASAVLAPGAAAPFNQWYWSENSEQFGSRSVYRNPGNGFGTGCTAFTTKSSCTFGVGNPVHNAPDQSFNLSGTRTLPAPPPPPPAGESAACTAAKAALESAKAKLKAVKRKAKKADGEKAEEKASAKVKKAKGKVKKASAAVTEAC